MKALFWNIRGFGARGRRDQLKDLVRSKNIDIIGLVETLKHSFSPNELSTVSGTDRFDCNFVAHVGHSGGILLGTKRDLFILSLLTMVFFGLARWCLIVPLILY